MFWEIRESWTEEMGDGHTQIAFYTCVKFSKNKCKIVFLTKERKLNYTIKKSVNTLRRWFNILK